MDGVDQLSTIFRFTQQYHGRGCSHWKPHLDIFIQEDRNKTQPCVDQLLIEVFG